MIHDIHVKYDIIIKVYISGAFCASMPCCPWYPVMLRGLSSCFSALSCWGHSGRLFLAVSFFSEMLLSVFVQDFKRVWKVAIQARDPWTLFVLWFLSLVSLQSVSMLALCCKTNRKNWWQKGSVIGFILFPLPEEAVVAMLRFKSGLSGWSQRGDPRHWDMQCVAAV